MKQLPTPTVEIELDPAAVRLDETSGQGQAQARAALAQPRVADLAELLEDMRLVLGGDAHAGVGHGDPDRAVDPLGRHGHEAPARA